jgi:hypothetical protein
VKQLKSLLPVQNGGASAKKIADLCKSYALYKGERHKFLSYYQNQPVPVRIPETQVPELALI